MVDSSTITVDSCAPILREARYSNLWHAGGVTAALATIALHDDDMVSTIANYSRLRRNLLVEENAQLAFTVDDIRVCKREGLLAVVLMFQSSTPLDSNADNIAMWYQLGVRSMNLAYNQATPAADGCMESRDAGLSKFGRQVVREMNRVGMLLDLSHTGHRSSLEAIELSAVSPTFTHSNAWNVFEHPRNLRDDQIRAVADAGGVIGVNGHPAFIKEGTAHPTLDDFFRHLDYMVELAGVDHVGLGLDFSQAPNVQISEERYEQMLRDEVWTERTLPRPPWTYPVADASKFGIIGEALSARGWGDDEVDKVLGGNFMSLFTRVWK